MKLYTILEDLSSALPDQEIIGITDNTQMLADGMIFV